MYRLVRPVTCLALFSLATVTTSALQAGYIVTDLGALPGGTYSYAGGLNDQGTVVGSSGQDSMTNHAFKYRNGKLQDIGGLPGQTYAFAAGVNSAGQVVGSSGKNVFLPNDDSRAFLYSQGKMQNLGFLPGDKFSSATGINQAGVVVGTSGYVQTGILFAITHAFAFSNGVMKNLGTLSALPGDSSFGNAINSLGDVTGGSSLATAYDTHAFLYKNGKMQNLGTLPGGGATYGTAINKSDQVAGVAMTSTGPAHAFLYKNGAMHDLGTLGSLSGGFSNATGINDSGKVVGITSVTYGGFEATAGFLYVNGKMTDLNNLLGPNSHWHVSSAAAINNRDEIVGTGISPDGTMHAILLTPDGVHPAPEPTTLTLGLIGLIGLGWAARRHHTT